jgi:predicted membrane protein (TIGR00267 family)
VGKLGSPFKYFTQIVYDVREYERIAGFSQIARRALANNAFDGVLTMIGVLMGNYLGGVLSAGTVIRIGVATSISIGISGLWGAYLAESAERGRELAELERISLTDLGGTKIGRASRMAVVIVSLIDGLAPFVSSLIVLIPLFAEPMIGSLLVSLLAEPPDSVLSVLVSYALSFIVALFSLFGLGMFLGHISGRSLVGYGLRTIIAGIVAIVINALLPIEP